jgi:hypothetical protein
VRGVRTRRDAPQHHRARALSLAIFLSVRSCSRRSTTPSRSCSYSSSRSPPPISRVRARAGAPWCPLASLVITASVTRRRCSLGVVEEGARGGVPVDRTLLGGSATRHRSVRGPGVGLPAGNA